MPKTSLSQPGLQQLHSGSPTTDRLSGPVSKFQPKSANTMLFMVTTVEHTTQVSWVQAELLDCWKGPFVKGRYRVK